jgi:hypothetical protein
MLTVGRRAVTRGSVKIPCCVITRFGLSVTEPGRDVTVLRSQAGLPAAHPGQLVGPGIFAVLGGLGTVFGRNLAVVNSLCAVICSLGVRRWGSRSFACGLLTLVRCAVSRGVIARSCLSVALLGLSVAYVRGQIAVASFYVPFAWRRQGLFMVRQSVPA